MPTTMKLDNSQPPMARGFTLIELMIVIAIIGVLATIAISSYNGYRQQAYTSHTLSDVRHLFMFESAFFDEHRIYAATSVSDVDGNGAINKNITLPYGGTASFHITGLSVDVRIAAKTDAVQQTITVGGKHSAGQTIIAIDIDAASQGYKKKTLADSFSDADLPDATQGNDLSNWDAYP